MGYHPQHQIQGQVMLNQPSQERHYRNSQDHPGHFRQHGHYHQNQHMGQGGYHNRNMGGHKNKGPGNKSQRKLSHQNYQGGHQNQQNFQQQLVQNPGNQGLG